MRSSLRFSPLLALLLGATIGFTLFLEPEGPPRDGVQAPPCLEGITLVWVSCQREGDAVTCWIDVTSPMIDRVLAIRGTSYLRFMEGDASAIRPARGSHVLPLAANQPVRVGVSFDDVPETVVVSPVFDVECTEVVFRDRPVE